MEAPSAYGDMSDGRIKQLLASDVEERQHLGLVFLDDKKRELIGGWLRRWSDDRGWRLSSTDIAIIYEKTIDSIRDYVENGEFKTEGNLNAFVGKFAYRRAIDFLRRRIPINPDLDVEPFAISRYDAPHEQPVTISLKQIVRQFHNLSNTERRVIIVDVRLYLAKDCKKWPSPTELMYAVNDNGQPQLTLDAVRSARARARRKLRGADTGQGAQK